MAGFDRKHEVLLDKIRDLQGEVELTKKLSASTLGSVAMLKAERLGVASLDEVRQNLDSSFGMAAATDRLMSQFLKKTS